MAVVVQKQLRWYQAYWHAFSLILKCLTCSPHSFQWFLSLKDKFLLWRDLQVWYFLEMWEQMPCDITFTTFIFFDSFVCTFLPFGMSFSLVWKWIKKFCWYPNASPSYIKCLTCYSSFPSISFRRGGLQEIGMAWKLMPCGRRQPLFVHFP